MLCQLSYTPRRKSEIQMANDENRSFLRRSDFVTWISSFLRHLSFGFRHCYLSTFVTTPEPTVRPPSRMANRTLASMAIGEINSTSSLTLSPGMHISASPNSLALPVTSVVRK